MAGRPFWSWFEHRSKEMCCPQTVDEDTKDDEDVHMVTPISFPQSYQTSRHRDHGGGRGYLLVIPLVTVTKYRLFT